QKVGDWLRALQNKNFAAREYEYTPLTDIHRWAGHGSQGIFDSIVVFENYPVSETLKADSPGGLVFGDVEIKEETNYPLTLVVTGSDKLALEFNYDNAFYDEQSIERLSQHFSQVLTQFIEGKTQRLGEIEFVSDSEVKQLELWGVNETKYDNSVPVHQLIEQQVALTPNATALVFEEEQLTYTELNQRANQLAHYLIAQGVKPEDKVGIAVERSVEMVVSLLAVLKSGAAYVPLDPELPQARIEYIIKSSELKLLLSQSHLSANIKGGSDGVYLAMLDKLDIAGFSTENPKIKIKGEQLAYVIYTSGSTGKPKGVANTHGALYNRLAWMQEVYSLTPDDKVLQKTPFGFDVSVWEFFWPLMYGARLVVAPVSIHKDPEELIKTINQHQISTLHFVPSMMQAFIASESATSCTSLTRIVCSGEALPAPLQATTLKKLPQAQLYNLYGPTEAAIDVTHWTCDGNGDVPVPIGSPISATSTYVLDSGMNLVPQGAIGELYLGGIGLARGYLNRTDLTSAFFIANPFSKEGGRLYRTGDLVHWNNAGALEYQGRIDYQVKIRGFRVELGEIESALLKQVDVSEAVVVAKESQSSTRLVAYISPNTNTEVDTMELKAVLSQSLPDYMVPSIIVLLDALPLNLNGKIDRKALPEPEFVSNNEYQAPVGEVEVLLAKIWSEVLNVEKIGRHDNFFELGGDSITSLRLVSKINYQLNGQLSVRNIFEQQTLKEQALLVINDEKHTPPLLPKLKTVPRQQYMPLSLSQTSLWLADKLALSAHDKSAYNIAGGVELNGTLDKEKLNAAFKLVIARHEVFRMAFTEQEENPVVTLVSEIAFNMVQHDLSQLSVIDKIAVAQQVKRNFEAKPFDLTQAPLLRAELIVLSGEKVQLLVNMHHIISDGWSVSILVKELGVAYQSLLKNSLPSWPELAIQYVDFAIWQNSLLKSVAMSDSIKFWQQYLKEAPTCSALPVHIPRAEQQSSKGDSVSFTFDAPTTSALKQLALKHKVSLYTLLLSSYQLFLHALLDQGDIVVGTDMAGREQQELQALIGFFINVVPVRSIFDKEQSVAQVLKSCQENTLNVSANQMLPYEKILESANSKRQSTISPLIQQLFVMQNTPEMIWPVADIELNVLPAEINSSKFDSAMFLTLENDILKANWVYRSKLYKAVKMQQLAKYWQKLVEKIIQNDSVTNTQLINQFKKEIQTMEKTSRLSKFSKLKKGPVTKKVRSKVQVKSSFFSEDAIFPIMLQPNSPDLDPISWAESNRPFIENKLLTNGGIVFRDFGIKTPQEFEAFAEAILPGLHGAYGDLPKKEGGKNTYRSTPYPEKQMILYHNESAHLECWPRKQWFFCELPSAIGGATPIVDGREMLKRLPASLLEKFESKGLLYIRTFNKNLDVSWQHFYKTDSKQAVEKRLDDAGISYQWLDNDGLQTRTYCPAVITHPISGERSFFNQVQLHHSYCLEPDIRNDLLALVSEEFLPRNVHFGDGSKISDEEMRIVGESYEACAIRFDWKKGDVVMVDNMIVSHARDPFEGARKIVVAMGDIVTKTQLQAGTYISSVKAIKSEEVPA
ncbi:MAG: amino acid adenylation domain-containing protein, partial [Cellvibrionaceae bacterium]